MQEVGHLRRLSWLFYPQRCLQRKDTAAPWQNLFELSGDASAASFIAGEVTAVGRPLHETTRPDVLKTPNIDRTARSLENLAGKSEVATTL